MIIKAPYMCRKKCETASLTCLNSVLTKIWCIRCIRGPLSTVICSECWSRNCCIFCLKADAEPVWKSVLREKKKSPKSVKMSPHRSGWWQAAFWKWAALVYTQNISSTWESGDGAHICARGVERRTQRVCLNPCHKSMSAWRTRRHCEAYPL